MALGPLIAKGRLGADDLADVFERGEKLILEAKDIAPLLNANFIFATLLESPDPAIRGLVHPWLRRSFERFLAGPFVSLDRLHLNSAIDLFAANLARISDDPATPPEGKIDWVALLENPASDTARLSTLLVALEIRATNKEFPLETIPAEAFRGFPDTLLLRAVTVDGDAGARRRLRARIPKLLRDRELTESSPDARRFERFYLFQKIFSPTEGEKIISRHRFEANRDLLIEHFRQTTLRHPEQAAVAIRLYKRHCRIELESEGAELAETQINRIMPSLTRDD